MKFIEIKMFDWECFPTSLTALEEITGTFLGKVTHED
jgi:hypothetical protein